jgi:hypothetical protein
MTSAIFISKLPDKLISVSRGLGERQRLMLDQLAGRDWVPLHELADDPDDPNEMAKARSAARGLERRGLVLIASMTDESRLIDTTVVTGSVGGDWSTSYTAEPTQRVWHGMHVCLQRQS